MNAVTVTIGLLIISLLWFAWVRFLVVLFEIAGLFDTPEAQKPKRKQPVRLFRFSDSWSAYYWPRMQNVPTGVTACLAGRIVWIERPGREWIPLYTGRKKFGPVVVYWLKTH